MAFKLCIASTKGGVGKTTLAANLGAIIADLFGQRVLLVDADPQPAVSSYFPITHRAVGGLSALIVNSAIDGVISHTNVNNLDMVVSDDPEGRLRDWILHTPDGRVRLKHTLSKLDNAYDIILIDTQGAVGPLQDAAVLAADMLLSPIPPEILSAREFARGTVGMLDRLRPMSFLGAPVPPLRGLIYKQDRTADAKSIAQEMRSESFMASRGSISILDTIVPAAVAYREAATHCVPVHRWESQRKGNTPTPRDTLIALVRELFPHLADVELRAESQPEPDRAAVAL